MMRVDGRLLRVEAELVVTITAPLDRRRPGNDEDRIRIRTLLADARIQVLATADSSSAESLLDRLDAAAAEVELDAGAQGVVIVVTSELAETHLLPLPVAEAVTVGATPATPFLVQGLRRSPLSAARRIRSRDPPLRGGPRRRRRKWSPMASRCRPTSSGGTAGPAPDASPGRRLGLGRIGLLLR
jgi:hypothetical protein